MSSLRATAVVLAGAFALLFAAIIVVANRGEGGRYWSFLHEIPLGDKLGHFALLGLFSMLLNLALGGRRAPGRLAFVMLGSLILVVVMTVEEFSQLFLAARSFDGFDWLANIAGIFAGEASARRLRRSRTRAGSTLQKRRPPECEPEVSSGDSFHEL